MSVAVALGYDSWRINPITGEIVPAPTFGAVDVTDWTNEEINDDFDACEAEIDAWKSSTVPAPLIVGQKYKATTTGTNRGRRIFRDITFTAARTSIEEDFSPARGDAPAQSRIFQGVYVRELDRIDAHPLLIVAGSLEAVSA